ncbi:hypothetical protein GCM10022408_05830 [Hymenobacter fastidiosus]|uniref:Periplasmic heavy metal sensor n=1 Tax=Hymenobacter fastidiosus TaxID=486264 RepID=A0ABP7RI77_9BACT
MFPARSLLLLALFSTLTLSCARRNKVDIPVAKSVVVTPAPAPEVPKAAARDLADVMTDELGLNPDQQTKVRTILRSTVQQVNDARQRLGGDKTALTAELRRINTSAESDLRTVLTATQYKEYQAKKRAMQAQMQARRAAAK